jgi:hypothetical protein
LAALLREAGATDLTSTTVPAPPVSTTAPRLRRAQVITVIVLLILGAVAAIQQFDLHAQLGSTPQLAGQYDRLAGVEAHLIEARNQAALRALGVAGADPTAALNKATAGLVDAAAARPSDEEALASVGQATVAYAALLQAPASAAQLTQADQLLSGTLQPTLQQLRSALQTQTGQRAWSYNPLLLWLAVVVAGIGLLLASVEVARRTRRTVNIGLLLAVIAALVSAWLGLAGVARAGDAEQANRAGTFDQVVALSNGRLALADLRHQLTSAAVTRSASAEAQAAIADRLKELSSGPGLPPDSSSALADAYSGVDVAVAKGDWAKVTTQLTKAAPAEKAFTADLGEATNTAVTAGTDTTQTALTALMGQAIAALVFALGGAGAGYWGISRRLRDYR